MTTIEHACRCGITLHHNAKVEMIGGRVHSVIGCEIASPLEYDFLAAAVTAALGHLREADAIFKREGKR